MSNNFDKMRLISMATSNHIPAPESIPLNVILDELNSFGLTVKKRKRIVNLLSAKVVLLVKN